MSRLVRAGQRGPAVLAAVAALWCASAAEGAPLTVVGFNVQSDRSSDLVIGRQLERSSDIDLWGLTEIYRRGGWDEKLRVAAGAGEPGHFGAVVGKTGRGNESLILYRSDRLRLLGSEELKTVTGGRAAAPLVARFRLDGDVEFLFVVVRLSNRAATRLEQTRRLADWAAAQKLPVVATGTFAFEAGEGQAAGDEAMAHLLQRTGWQWVRPEESPATLCGQERLVQDFVFAGGAAGAWSGTARVTFLQSNYCKDNDAYRSSDHRPVIAGFDTDGGAPRIAGVMPERQIGPFLPALGVQGEVREARDESAQPALVTEAGSTPPVIEAGSPPPVGDTAPAPAATSAPTSAPAPSRAPAPAPAASATPPPAPVAPVSSPQEAPPPDPQREALLKRLEALEREAREIREALESEGED